MPFLLEGLSTGCMRGGGRGGEHAGGSCMEGKG